jgi:orotate phosphoribosyltransferase-like protein
MPYYTEAKLFEVGDFISHAGLPLAWKIECDAIRPEWWNGLARMIMDYQTEPFSKVVGIPRGGLPLQSAMEKYVTPGDHPWLVVDDVYTTGTSFREFCTDVKTMHAYKWVIFARKPIPEKDGVRALFTMPAKND